MDINADLGEWYGKRNLRIEADLMPYLSSCNVACGFHSGDPLTIEKTIRLALQHDVKIGAHPSFPDLQGFGRRMMHLPLEELKAIIRYQIAALKGMTEALGGQLHHVKLHGALYNEAMKNVEIAKAASEVIQSFDDNLVVYGLPNSALENAAKQLSLRYWGEGFADRVYEDDLSLRSRQLNHAVLHDLEQIKKQVQHFKNGKVATYQKNIHSIDIQTLCIHSDMPNAIDIAKMIFNEVSDMKND